MITLKDRFLGCILGGAVGDAFGYPLEFLSNEDIQNKYGTNGLSNPIEENGFYRISDDTQMTMFTIEGILLNKNQDDIVNDMYKSYLRWFNTQFGPNAIDEEIANIGDLHKISALYEMRNPGHACIDSLRSGRCGTIDEPVNLSKGSGALMRTSPIGLCFAEPFDIARKCAALTHGHEYAHITSGFLAELIHNLAIGCQIEIAIRKAKNKTLEYYNFDDSLNRYISTFSSINYPFKNSTLPVFLIGDGWTSEEALSISCYAALRFRDNFREAIIYSANHSGDSDTTASITGSILGTYLGVKAIPDEWINKLEFKDILIELADRLYNYIHN